MRKKIFGRQDCVFTEGKVTRIGPKSTKNFAFQKNRELADDAVTKLPEGHQGSIEPIKNPYLSKKWVANAILEFLCWPRRRNFEAQNTEGKSTKISMVDSKVGFLDKTRISAKWTAPNHV